jgi:hypothetical protein
MLFLMDVENSCYMIIIWLDSLLHDTQTYNGFG